jgi:hypothetical protein
MAPSDNSFTDNLSAVDRIYATRSGVATPDEDGNVTVPHIDSENQAQPGADETGFGGDAPEPEGGHPEVGPDDLTEEELEDLTDPRPVGGRPFTEEELAEQAANSEGEEQA